MSRLFVKLTYFNLSLLIGILFSLDVHAQTASQFVAKGNKELKDGYFQSALFYYKKALHLDTNDLDANFQAAEAYRKLRNYRRAEDFYLATIKVDGRDVIPEARFYHGMMLQQQGKYEKAIKSFESFQSIYRSRDEFYRSSRDLIASCQWALEHKSDTTQYEVSSPDSGLNTVHAEMSPYLWDTSTIYFSTMRYERDEVKKSNPAFVEVKKAVKDSNVWTLTTVDLPISEEPIHFGNGTFSPDTTQFYFTRCEELSRCKIYVSNRVGDEWSTPVPLPFPVNDEESSNTQPTVAVFSDASYLIFASDRGTGKGGMDLWYVPLRQGEPTNRVRNMGNNVNTAGDEITPFFDAYDSTLYFSSNRLLGFGGFDIFNFKGEPGSSEIPENLGPEINTPADDYYFMSRSVDSIGYFASNRLSGLKKEGNETCCNDLYVAHLIPPVIVIDTTPIDTVDTTEVVPPVVVEIENPKTLEELQTLLPISLYFHNDRPNPRTMSTTTRLTYTETIEEYQGLYQEYIDAVNRSNLDGNRKMELGNGLEDLFENKLERSITQLDKALNVLLGELADSSQIKLAVKGFASPLADSRYNLNLTYRRIASMENYIQSFNDGAFQPYLKSGQLSIEKIPYGETQAAQNVSDDLNDELSAIYSPDAAQERRIEILRIEREN